MNRPIALVSDFDGTISDKDFFYYIADKYFDDVALRPWKEFLSGKKKHFIALSEMFGMLRIPQKELDAFIKTINLDKSFFKLAEFCKATNIPVTICSAGNDYYINKLMGRQIEKYGIKLVSNHGVYSEKNGLQMSANEEYYDEELGVSKLSIVNDWQKRGYFVIYCGDGLPDVAAAGLADMLFARGMLYEKCIEQKIRVAKLDSFEQVQKFIEERLI